ncbi:SPW repeat protein [Labrys wisconsinensis]|uniref:Membrane protein YfhO n=1 Tax=Labrys wisconsinensis TaxID=425677 RepID=A0ABU0J9G5_9HYPH|nr:SPW repeat protein [Labrys wisconsinensis]MDQ0470916.1 putative membrane protein YfhO [Labrys wisconsinensis]
MALQVFRTKRSQDWLLLVLAVALFAAPWALGFAGDRRPAWNACVVAVLLAYLACASLSEFKAWEEWVTLALGAWLVAAPWALGFAADIRAAQTHWILGALTMLVSLWAEWAFRHARLGPPAA